VQGSKAIVKKVWVPHQIISDNAQQFKVAKTALNKTRSNVLMNSDVNDYSAQQGEISMKS